MKQWKIALSLAIVGAIAAPFALHTYQMYPTFSVLVPFSESEKEHRAGYLKETNNCQTLKERIDQLRQTDPSEFLEQAWRQIAPPLLKGLLEHEKSIAINRAIIVERDCETRKEEFERGGLYEQSFDTFKYVLFNSMAASAGFVVVYALTFLLPFVVLRYSRWLNTHFPFTVSLVKQRKIAISLAVVGALAAPFVTGAWQMQPVSLTPISADKKKALMTHMEDSKNCQREVWNVAIWECEDWKRELLQGGLYGFSQPKWLALNLFAALAGFVVVFGLTYLVPGLAIRYWRWLNT